jgi:hypothetical protein
VVSSVVAKRLRARRASIAARRRALATARALPAVGSSGSSTVLITALAQANDHLMSLSTVLAQARTGLVQELIEVRSPYRGQMPEYSAIHSRYLMWSRWEDDQRLEAVSVQKANGLLAA